MSIINDMDTFKRMLLVALLCLVAAALIGWLRPALAADAGSCYVIADGDARTYCLARAHGDPGRCYSIMDSGLRSQCLAEVRK